MGIYFLDPPRGQGKLPRPIVDQHGGSRYLASKLRNPIKRKPGTFCEDPDPHKKP